RDLDQLEQGWPHLRLRSVKPFMPFRYLASGGVSMRSLQPGWLFEMWRRVEKPFGIEERLAVFAFIIVERI
ncbi:MAG: methyltransferase type 11, partial [Acidimicrobiia bacterium]